MFSIDTFHYINSENIYIKQRKGAFTEDTFYTFHKTDTIKQNFLLLYDC